jgi:hypothetical protein
MKHKRLSAIVLVQVLVLALSLSWAAPATAQPHRSVDVTPGNFGGVAHLADLAFERALDWLKSLWAPDGGAADPNGTTSDEQTPARAAVKSPMMRVTKRPV